MKGITKKIRKRNVEIKTLSLALMLILTSCGGTKQESNAYDYYEYVYAYTSGTISRASNIFVSFAESVVESDMVNKEIANGILNLSPKIPGKAIWSSTSSIQFTPNSPLDYNADYQATINLDKVIPEIPDPLDEFVFSFQTREPYVSLTIDGITNLSESNLTWQQLTGNLILSDFEDLETIEKIVQAELGGDDLKIRWELNNDSYTHRFTIDSIQRTKKTRDLVVTWDGSPIDFNQDGSETYEILAEGIFRLISTQSPTGTAQEIILEFSDPIGKNQNLRGLVSLNGSDDMEYRIDKNKVYIYPKFRLIGNVDVLINKNLKNSQGGILGDAATSSIIFQEIKPQLKLIGKGSIVPQSGAVPFPFEAVNLSAVDIRIIKVFSKSVPQFLQVNELAESNELKRVGHLVALKKVKLDQDKSLDLKAWNKHVIDLNSIISTEPGAIYEISLGFRRSYSLYSCTDSSAMSNDSQSMLNLPDDWNDADPVSNEDSYWDYSEDYYNDNDYSERDEPCTPSYYYDGRVIKRNVLASNLGIIAKSGPLGDMTIAITDIRTTDPKAGTEIEIYSFQQALLKRTTTNSDGIASFKVNGKPFLVVAKSGTQRGYLKVNDANSLSISRFDVGGAKQKEGINGFVYTERGVWRPGDSIYVNLMIQDDGGKLPHNHPVKFELFSPSGQLVDERITKKHVNRLYNFYTATAADAPTGNYTAKMTVGGTTFTKSLKVETIMPNRLKLALDFGKDYIAKGMDDLEAELAVTWLHGAIAKNLVADVSVNLTSAKTQFNRYEDFIFDDPSRKFYPEDKTIYSGVLDDEGKATVNADIEVDGEAPGMLTANFKARAFEPGGSFSTERFSMPYHPYENYVGLKLPKGDKARGMLLTDTNHIVQIATLNPAGEPTTGRNISMKVYKLDWKWWWDKTANDVDFNGRYYGTPVAEGSTTSSNGEAKWTLRVNYPQWGRYLIRACDDESGHCSSKIMYMDWPGWAGRGQKDKTAGANMLTFTSDKKEYVVGEEITLNLPTPEAGRAFVSIEKQNKVLETYWVNTQKGTTRFTFDAKASMAPNVFANVTLLQPHGQSSNDLPIRMFGVIPIKIINPATQLSPMLAMNDVLEPESDVEIEVSEQEGKSMTYTLALVDEGLLGLTRFRTPNPWNHFYARQGLSVQTWDLYENILGADAAKYNSLLSIGGDGYDDGPEEGKKQNRFRPVLKVLGPFELKPGETKKHVIRMPNYIGAVRTMVVAKNDKAYGSVFKETPVKKPLMILGTLPRVLGLGEEITLPITCFALENHVKNVSITVEGNEFLKVEGQETRKLTFTDVGDQLTNFTMKVGQTLGTGQVKITAKGGGEKAVYWVGVQVRSPNPPMIDVYEGEIKASATWSKDFVLKGITGTHSATLELSSVQPINMDKRLKYLIQYPHGCVEQTTSSVFPQLFVSTLIKIDGKQRQSIDRNVKAGIKRLSTFQTNDGGLGYWPGAYSSNEWGTNYAGHFILEAKKKGYRIPSSFLNKWKDYQKKKARMWLDGSNGDQLTQSYRLYLLAYAGDPELGAMNRMRLKSGLNNTAKWYLAAAYELASNSNVAAEIAKGANLEVKTYKELSGTYGSELRDKAIILHACVLLGKNNLSENLVTNLSKQLASNSWYSTQTTAYTLYALTKFYEGKSADRVFSFEYKLGDGKWQTTSSNKFICNLKFTEAQLKGKKLSIRNQSDKILYSKWNVQSTPMPGNEDDASNGMELTVKYYTTSGESFEPTSLEQGQDFIAEVSIKNSSSQNLEEMALTQIFPSGWEIHNTRLDGDGYMQAGTRPTYLDIRDDRVYSYFDLSSGSTKTFKIMLNAAYLGKYYLPAVSCEAMYDASINARQKGQWVNIVKGGAL